MYLGVDGGGTRTGLILIDKSGRIVARHEEAPAYHIEIGVDGLRRTLCDGVSHVLAQANCSANEVDFAFFGLPCYGEDSTLLTVLEDLPGALFRKDQYRCDNDVVCGWAAAQGCADGINVVAGTGSIAYGEWKNDQARCGGWGEIFGDEGSAYWIGRSALQRFSKMSDGRIEQCALYDLIKTELCLRHDLDICAVVLDEWSGSRSKIAQLSELVCQSAQSGDLTAIDIFRDAASELAEIVDSTRRRLSIKSGDRVPVSYSGGVFNAAELILEPLACSLRAHSPDYALVSPRYLPVVGSALYAAKLDGFAFSTQSLAHLELKSTPDLAE